MIQDSHLSRSDLALHRASCEIGVNQIWLMSRVIDSSGVPRGLISHARHHVDGWLLWIDFPPLISVNIKYFCHHHLLCIAIFATIIYFALLWVSRILRYGMFGIFSYPECRHSSHISRLHLSLHTHITLKLHSVLPCHGRAENGNFLANFHFPLWHWYLHLEFSFWKTLCTVQ